MRITVRGTVARNDGQKAAGARVTAGAKGLRSETPLGEATSDTDGSFRIEYPADGRPVDLVLRASADGLTVETIRRGVVSDAAVELTLPGDERPEHERLLAAVEPLLDGVALNDLAGPDIAYLARTTRWDQAAIEGLAAAARAAVATGLAAESFYGAFREGLPTDPAALAELPVARVRSALESAAAAHVIAAADGDFADSLRRWHIAAAVDGASTHPVGALVSAAFDDQATRQRMFGAYLDQPGDAAELWPRLDADNGSAADAARLKLALELGTLTDDNAPLVRTLLAKFDRGELNHPRELVGLTDAWPALVEQTGVAAASAVDQAQTLRERAAEAYPTAALTHSLANHPAHAESPATRFLVDNPDFDLLGTPVNAATVPDEQARHDLAGIQRTFKLTRRFDAMQTLRDNGFTSAHAIAGVAGDTFAAKVADTIGEAEAQDIHARASHVHATAANLVADFRTAGHFDVQWLPSVTPADMAAADAAAPLPIPDWEELFGNADYGTFAESRSVHSEAAYLADLLYYVRRLGAGSDSYEGPVAGALYARRDDIHDVELSDANTDLSLPYVDLVNELLESAVAPEPGSVIPASQRQSDGDSATLRIQPQHVNSGAYKKLSDAVYPWDLPFDLWREQTNAYLSNLGVTRVSLLEGFGPAADSPTLLDDERLGLNTVAARIIAGEQLTPARSLAQYYGRPASSDLVGELHTVRALLDAASLRYAELTELLATRFVNPGGAVTVLADSNSPYDTTKMTLPGLDVGTLDRLHRFTRLRRVLGWSAADLDRAIAGSNNQGRLDRTTLRAIGAVRHLASRLDLTLDRVLAFHNPLDTYRYQADEQAPLYDRLFLDPAVVSLPTGTPSPFALRADRTELAVLGSLTTPVVTGALLAVLQVGDQDLAALVTGPRSVVPDRGLNLANLSTLVRTVTLANALTLSIPDLLRLIELAGAGGPFPSLAGTFPAGAAEVELAGGQPMAPTGRQALPVFANGAESELTGGAPMTTPTWQDVTALPTTDGQAVITERFIDAVQAIQNAGFGVAELDAVLTDTLPADGGVLPDDDTLAAILSTLRTALQAVYRQTTPTVDERGEMTRKALALLGWDPVLAQDAVSTLLGTVTYTADLTSLPDTVVFPAAIPIRYHETDQQLVFTGTMTAAQLTQLGGLLADPAYQAALQTLHAAPRSFVTTRMKALRIPVYAAPLTQLAPDFPMPKSLVGKVYFDAADHTLKSRGYLSLADADALRAATKDQSVLAAVDQLLVNQEAPAAADNVFLTAADAAAFFDADTTPVERFQRVLGILNPLLRRQLSETTVKQQLGQAAGLDPAGADLLLGSWLQASGTPVWLDFVAADFAGSDQAVPVTRATFGRQFVSLGLINRVALALGRLQVASTEIPFLFGRAAAGGWLDLNALPAVPTTGASPLFGPFTRLLDLIRLRSAIPGGIATLDAVFTAALAGSPQVVATLAARTGWPVEDTARLATLLGLTQPVSFANVAALQRVLDGVRTSGKLGVTADRIGGWLTGALTPDVAQAAWQAAVAKHTPADWPTAAAPMQDAIRVRQRAALVSYLLANPLRAGDNTPQWHDTNGLHDYFLLDVEMGASQQTTRIAQAIYSVQLFVQRCLLNLEPQVTTSDNALWREWEWMQQYQLWVANQKVFLYPENYLEPDLRPDKSSFFADFENEIMQKEITDDNVLAASHHYLEKLSTVSRLHPCGTFLDKPNNKIYVFARSESTPRVYYYRVWENKTVWTPWEKIDLDIGSETLVPVVWRGQLYLFWPMFTPAADTPSSIDSLPDGTPGHTLTAPTRYWNLQFNWSKRTEGGWEAKKITEPVISTRLPVADLQHFDPGATSPYFFSADGTSPDNLHIWVAYNSPYLSLGGEQVRVVGWFDFSPMGRVSSTQLHVPGIGDPGYLDGYVAGPVPSTTSINNEFPVWDDLKLIDFRGVFQNPTLLPIFGHIPAGPGRTLFPFDSFLGYLDFYLLYSDGLRSYAIEFLPPHAHSVANSVRLHNLYHAHVDKLLAALIMSNVDDLYARDLQLISNRAAGTFIAENPDQYNITGAEVVQPYPDEDIDFTAAGGYSGYNWEVFLHVPLLLAERLTTNQDFTGAQKWFHRIFDPTDRSGLPAPQRFWRTKPFYLTSTDDSQPGSYYQQRVEEILKRLAAGNTDEQANVQTWLDNPFQPDVIARLRTTAYQKSVVMKYLDNLIAWGDQLYRQDTGESVNKAAQLYLLAAEVLGRRPEEVYDATPAPSRSFRGLVTGTASAVVAAEHLVSGQVRPVAGVAAPSVTVGVGLNWLNYFHVPRNEKLLSYWDVVDDRLSKIRSGLTIDGQAAQLSAFGAEIDPGVLVRAVATGQDLTTALADISAPVPHYRFATMLAKAKELANEVKSFGSALLSALEKRDAEALARLRSRHEITLLAATRVVKQQQIWEADAALAAADSALSLAQQKRDYYGNRSFMNGWEIAHTSLSGGALVLQSVAAGIHLAGSVTSNIPEIKIGFPTTVGATYGGSNVSNSLQNLASSLGEIAGILSGGGALAATIGGYRRRMDDWDFQKDQAQVEIEQARHQIDAARTRQQVAWTELDNSDLQARNAAEEDRFIYGKYTNQELYDWMAGQLATSFFQAYQLAYDVAKRAERAYRHELGVEDSTFITFGYWDSLHKGLLSGERLASDLNRMDAAYLDANAREFELSKRISLAQLDPKALLSLKETGSCFVSLPEALFDIDTPGHYFRRIRGLAVTVPCVAGPYTGVNLTATLTGSSVRVDPRLADGKYARQPHDTRFRDYSGPIESIVTSTGQDDSGLFDANLRDERFLPFEGAGAVSQWQLSLPDEFRQFDYESITDVVLHLRYTARDGGGTLGTTAVGELRDALDTWVHGGGGKGQLRVFSARREFADQWNRFMATPAGGTATATFTLSKARFPQLFRDHRFTAAKPELVLVLSQDLQPGGWLRYADAYANGTPLHTTLAVGGAGTATDLRPDATLAGMPHGTYASVNVEITDAGQDWVVTAPITGLAPALLTKDGRLDPAAVLDLLLVCPYSLTAKPSS